MGRGYRRINNASSIFEFPLWISCRRSFLGAEVTLFSFSRVGWNDESRCLAKTQRFANDGTPRCFYGNRHPDHSDASSIVCVTSLEFPRAASRSACTMRIHDQSTAFTWCTCLSKKFFSCSYSRMRDVRVQDCRVNCVDRGGNLDGATLELGTKQVGRDFLSE